MLASSLEHRIFVDPVLYSLGLADGSRSTLRGSLSNNRSYLAGFHAGLKFYTCEVPAVQEGYLERGYRDQLLNPLA